MKYLGHLFLGLFLSTISVNLYANGDCNKYESERMEESKKVDICIEENFKRKFNRTLPPSDIALDVISNCRSNINSLADITYNAMLCRSALMAGVSEKEIVNLTNFSVFETRQQIENSLHARLVGIIEKSTQKL